MPSDTIGAKFIRNINAGEMIVVDQNGVRTVRKRKVKGQPLFI